MIVEKRNRLLVILLFAFCNRIGNAQNLDQQICTSTDTIFNSIISLELPCKYKKQVFLYDEGMFIDFHYPDGSMITLFKGALQKSPLFMEDSEHLVQSVDSLNGKVSYKGIIRDRVWREDKISGLYIYYNNVPTEKKFLFEQVLDRLSITEL